MRCTNSEFTSLLFYIRCICCGMRLRDNIGAHGLCLLQCNELGRQCNFARTRQLLVRSALHLVVLRDQLKQCLNQASVHPET